MFDSFYSMQQNFTLITKHFILDIAAVVDPPLSVNVHKTLNVCLLYFQFLGCIFTVCSGDFCLS